MEHSGKETADNALRVLKWAAHVAFVCLIYNTWVMLNAKAREKMTTITIKLNYLEK